MHSEMGQILVEKGAALEIIKEIMLGEPFEFNN